MREPEFYASLKTARATAVSRGTGIYKILYTEFSGSYFLFN